MISELPEIQGLALTEQIGSGTRNAVFRGRRRGRVVAVKLPRQRQDSQAIYRQYCREAALQARIPDGALPQIYEVGWGEKTPFLVMELLEGKTLTVAISDSLLDGPRVQQLALDLCHGLSAIHQSGMVHRDLKPQNILLTPSGRARLLDFGLATRSHLDEDQSATGTFLYSAPEQTGMIHRALDGRADLYSLGVVMFECLTGRPPFTSKDPVELIRLHATAPLPDLRSLAPGLSPRLCQAVETLLRKDPDDRFDDVAGLQRFLEDDSAGGLPGSNSRALIGRESALDSLYHHWEVCSRRKQTRTVLVQAEKGMGKSALCQQFCERLGHSGVPVFAATGDWSEGVPLAAPREMMERIPQDHLRAEERSLLMESGDPSHRLSPENRFQALAQMLVRVISQRPGVVLVENLHSLDRSSLQVLQRLIDSLEGPVLVVLSSERAEMEGLACDELVALSPLDAQEVARLLELELGGTLAPEMAGEVLMAGNGNPGDTLEVMRSALDSGHFVPHWGGWRLEGGSLAELELPGGVQRAVVRRLEAFDAERRQMLQAGAILGLNFDLGRWGKVSGCEPAQLFRLMAEAQRLRLLEYRGNDRVGFVHLKVREALLESLEKPERGELHLRAAASLEGEEGTEQLLARARHLWEALEFGAETGSVGQANQLAGVVALSQHAAEEAYQYFTRAVACASPGESMPGPAQEAFGRACFLTGRFQQALEYFDLALAAAEESLVRAALQRSRAEVFMADMDTNSAGKALEAGLAEMGLAVKGTRFRLVWTGLWQWKPLSCESREHTLEAVRLLELECRRNFMDGRLPEMVEGTWLGLRLARSLGPSPAMIAFFGLQSSMLAALGLHKRALRLSRESIAIAESMGDPFQLAEARAARLVCLRLCGDDAVAATEGERILNEEGRWLSTKTFLQCCALLSHNYHFRGLASEALYWVELAQRRAGFSPVHSQLAPLGPSYAMVGRFGEAAAELLQHQNRENEPLFRRTTLLMSRLQYFVETGELGEGADLVVKEFESMKLRPRTLPVFVRTFYVLMAYLRLRQCESDRSRLGQVSEALKLLRSSLSLPVFRTHFTLVEAGLARLKGRRKLWKRKLVGAEALAHRWDVPWVRVEVAREKALDLKNRGLEVPAKREARLACNLAVEVGWLSRAQQLEREFGLDRRSSNAWSSSTGVSDAREVVVKSHFDALLAISQAAARVLEPKKLYGLVLTELVKLLGASRAFLFLYEGEDLVYQTGLAEDGTQLAEPPDYSKTVVSRVAKEGVPLILNGPEQGREMGANSVVVHDLRSVLAAPMAVRDRQLGVVYLDSRLARGVFGSSELQLLQALAGQMAVTLETARAARLEVQVTGERKQRLLAEQLGELVGSLLSALEMEPLLERLLEGLQKLIGFQAATVFLWDGHCLTPASSQGEPAALPFEELVPQDQDWVSVLHQHRPLAVDPGQIWAPLRSPHGLLGVVALEHQDLGGVQMGLIHTVCSYGAMAIENAKLFAEVERLATTDALTGVHNRRNFFAQAGLELQRADRLGTSLCAVMFDVDHFKKFNDTYGHGIGDLVISEVASRCQHQLRAIDLIGRYGGEEFAALLVGAELDDAVATAERLRRAVGETPFETEQGPLTVTISLGVSLRESGENLEQILEKADQALYRSKEEGRNRVSRA